uniref:FIP-RBD domain-containing protein n=2 Tax=Acrobeloides nanus TaxID=290746 RepID=A0A914DU18_9BILA
MKYLDPNSPVSDTSPNGMRFTSSPTSASVASRLYTNGQRSSRRTSFSSEPELMNFSDNEVHSEFNDISSQVSMISKKLTDMQENQMLTNEEKSRLKTENAVLQERVHILEEQFQVAEQRWKEKLDEEKCRAKDMLTRVEREKQLENESSSLKYQVLEKDLKSLKAEHEKLQEEAHTLRQNQDELRYQYHESQILCEALEQEKKQLKSEFDRYKQDAQSDMANSSELLEELTRQTENLRQNQFPRQGSLADQMVELEEEIESLRLENRQLREQNEDLHAQLLHDSVERGRSLLADGPPSLMAELNGMDSNELMNALKEQESCNQKLRDYINGILTRVIVMHPEILEIKDEELKERERQQQSGRQGNDS